MGVTPRKFFQYSHITGQKFERMPVPVLLLLISLFGGRWISYVGIPNAPIFFLDIAFVMTGVIYSFKGLLLNVEKLNYFRQKKYNQSSGSLTNVLSFLVVVYIFFQIIRMKSSPNHLVLRDCVPFIYLVLAAGMAKKLKHQSIEQLYKWIVFVGVLHCFWSIPRAMGLIEPIDIGGIFKEPIFDFRADHTGMVISITIIAALNLFAKGIATQFNFSLIVILPFLAILLHSRASLIAIFATCAISVLLLKHQGMQEGMLKFTIFPIFILSTLILLFSSSGFKLPENSVLFRIGLFMGPDSYVLEQAYWTQFGRERGQEILIEWIKNNNFFWLGAGPGSNMLWDSGAVKFLSGDAAVRSPHSWPVSAFARFGIIGFSLWALLCWSILSQKIKAIVSKGTISLYVALLPILIVSQFGVIMEAPFGVIPFATIMALIRSRNINRYDDD